MLLSFNFDVVNFCVNPNPLLKILLFALFSVGIVCRIVCLNIASLLKACTRTTSVVPVGNLSRIWVMLPVSSSLFWRNPWHSHSSNNYFTHLAFIKTFWFRLLGQVYICTVNGKRKRKASILKIFFLTVSVKPSVWRNNCLASAAVCQ